MEEWMVVNGWNKLQFERPIVFVHFWLLVSLLHWLLELNRFWAGVMFPFRGAVWLCWWKMPFVFQESKTLRLRRRLQEVDSRRFLIVHTELNTRILIFVVVLVLFWAGQVQRSFGNVSTVSNWLRIFPEILIKAKLAYSFFCSLWKECGVK